MKFFVNFLIIFFMIPSANTASAQQKDLMVRIAEIELHRESIKEYLAILKEEAAESLKLEPGVICIYPMIIKNDSTQIRLLEIYADKFAYESHIKSPHFIKYKTNTLKMVKSLKLIEMAQLDPGTMPEIFRRGTSTDKKLKLCQQ